MKLTAIGLRKNWIYEALVATYHIDGTTPNIAMMGISTPDMEHIVIRPYVTSDTYKNILHHRCAVIEFIYEPNILYNAVFKGWGKGPSEPELPPNCFKHAKVVNAPVLKDSKFWIEVRMCNMCGISGGRATIICEVVHIEGVSREGAIIRPYCRAEGCFVEALVAASRLLAAIEEKRLRDSLLLLQMLHICYDIIKRTAPDSEYLRLTRSMIEDIHERFKRAI